MKKAYPDKQQQWCWRQQPQGHTRERKCQGREAGENHAYCRTYVHCIILALDLWQWALQHGLNPKAVHVAGASNGIADRWSRQLQDSGDWQLDPMLFAEIQDHAAEAWELRLDIDLFASRTAAQLPAYCANSGRCCSSLHS